MLITEKIFQAFLECETKSFLKFSGLDGAQSESRDWQRYVAEDFKKKCFIHLRSNIREDEYLVGTLPTKGEENKYRFVLDCPIQPQGMLESNIHALERAPSSNKRNHHPYIPVRFIPNEKITRHDKLVLAFDALALYMASGKMPLFGKIIHSSELKIVKVRLAILMKVTSAL